LTIYIYSDFKDIFDVDHFKESLKEDIVIVDSLPPDYRRVKPYVRAPTSWSRVRVNNLLVLLDCIAAALEKISGV
jgi:hypothetical protein